VAAGASTVASAITSRIKRMMRISGGISSLKTLGTKIKTVIGSLVRVMKAQRTLKMTKCLTRKKMKLSIN
jgi:hypothetical protein